MAKLRVELLIGPRDGALEFTRTRPPGVGQTDREVAFGLLCEAFTTMMTEFKYEKDEAIEAARQLQAFVMTGVFPDAARTPVG